MALWTCTLTCARQNRLFPITSSFSFPCTKAECDLNVRQCPRGDNIKTVPFSALQNWIDLPHPHESTEQARLIRKLLLTRRNQDSVSWIPLTQNYQTNLFPRLIEDGRHVVVAELDGRGLPSIRHERDHCARPDLTHCSTRAARF